MGSEMCIRDSNNIAKESNNSDLYLKCHKNLLVSPSRTSLVSSSTRNSSTVKLVSTPGKRLGLPGEIYDVIAK